MNILIISGGVGLLIVLFFLTTRYRKIRHEGQALIVNGVGKTKASLTGTFIWPVVNRYEYMDITRKKISVNRSGKKMHKAMNMKVYTVRIIFGRTSKSISISALIIVKRILSELQNYSQHAVRLILRILQSISNRNSLKH